MRTTLLAAALATLAATAAEARSSMAPAPMMPAGTLTCTLDPSLGFVIGSARGAHCTYQRYGSRRIETYSGVMSRVGFDVGVTSGQVVTWKVLTPGGRNRPGMIGGHFAGPSADATVVASPGAPVLFSGSMERIALEPVGHSGQVGLGFALGEAGLDLRPAL